MEKSKTILVVAGEASGDLHAAHLVNQLKALDPQIEFFGLGGKLLEQQGVQIYYPLVELAVVGFFEVLRNIKKLKSIFRGILSEVERKKPDLAILVDYPGFNLRLARSLKERNIPVVYYISPQVWAWGAKRIKTIQKNIALMVVLFDFEQKLYQQHGVNVFCPGHPSLDQVYPKIDKQTFLQKFALEPTKKIIALLPGSRIKEVKTLLPVMLETALELKKHFGDNVAFVILRSTTVSQDTFTKIMDRFSLKAKLISDMTYEGLAASDFALVCSGTATLETAILGVPMVILYKLKFLSWLLGRMLIRIPYIGLVNIVAGRSCAAEFIQYQANAKRIAPYIIDVLSDQDKMDLIKKDLVRVKTLLGQPGATKRTAQKIADFLRNNTTIPSN